MPAKKWDKTRVLAAIHRRESLGLPLTSVWREDKSLWQAAKVQFGSWRRALVAAEVPGAQPLERWPKERVVACILARKRAGLLDDTWRQDRKLYGAAERRFGSWQHALVAAGVKEQYVPRRAWTREKIMEAIRERQREGQTLIGVQRHDALLFGAAQRHFGGWRNAVAAAGIEYGGRRTWTNRTVIEAIQTRHRSGLPLTNAGVHDPGLARAASKYFGSWHDAVWAAGIKYQRRRRWTRERLIQEIHKWYPHGELKGDVWTEDRGLAAAAPKHFGSWHNALKAAGIEPRRRMWSQARVLKELRAWRQGNPQTGLWISDKGLANAAKKHFGSIQQALDAAGLEPRQRGWTRQALIEAIQDRHVRGLTLRDGVEGQDTALVSSAKRHFGSWGAALQAAGIDIPWRRRWTNQKVVKELQHWHKRGLPLKSIADKYGALYGAVYRNFGSFSAALAAAGLEEVK